MTFMNSLKQLFLDALLNKRGSPFGEVVSPKQFYHTHNWTGKRVTIGNTQYEVNSEGSYERLTAKPVPKRYRRA